MVNLERLNSISSISDWKVAARSRRDNRYWQRNVQIIAVKILKVMRSKGINKGQLSEMLGIPNETLTLILKGQYDMPLSLISKIENILKLRLFNYA